MEKFRSTTSASNPFAAAPAQAGAEETPNILDLFGVAPPVNTAPAPAPAQPQQPTASAASDDLLQLTGNPFANMLNAGAPPSSSSPMFQSTPAPGNDVNAVL